MTLHIISPLLEKLGGRVPHLIAPMVLLHSDKAKFFLLGNATAGSEL